MAPATCSACYPALFSYALLQLFAISVLQRFIREKRQREETAALNRELLATRELLSQSAAQGERLRIARDLHDIPGALYDCPDSQSGSGQPQIRR